MNKEEQRIAIAEACGWKNADHPDVMKLKHGWTMPEKWCMDPNGVLRFNHDRPNHLNDLNAMHDAEKVLNEKQEDIIFWRQAYPYIRGCSCPDKPRRIIAEVLLKHRAFWRDMTAGRRDRETVLCRHEICYRLRQETDYSMPRIGRLLGGRDHTTVIHGCRQHKIRMEAK